MVKRYIKNIRMSSSTAFCLYKQGDFKSSKSIDNDVEEGLYDFWYDIYLLFCQILPPAQPAFQ